MFLYYTYPQWVTQPRVGALINESTLLQLSGFFYRSCGIMLLFLMRHVKTCMWLLSQCLVFFSVDVTLLYTENTNKKTNALKTLKFPLVLLLKSLVRTIGWVEILVPWNIDTGTGTCCLLPHLWYNLVNEFSYVLCHTL